MVVLEDEFPHVRKRFAVPAAVIQDHFKDCFVFADLRMNLVSSNHFKIT